jgi:hypothetical protein
MANRHSRSSQGRVLVPAMALLAVNLLGCDPKQGKLVTHDDVCRPENNDQRVTIAGYLTSERRLVFCSYGTCSLELRKSKDAEEPQVTVGIRPGGGKNQMATLPERYGPEDLKFTTNDGAVLGNLAHVRVTGKVLVGEGCQLLDVNLIEKAE